MAPQAHQSENYNFMPIQTLTHDFTVTTALSQSIAYSVNDTLTFLCGQLHSISVTCPTSSIVM